MDTALDPELAGTLDKLIVTSPFGRLVGLTTDRIDPDRVRVRLPFRHELTTVGETVHGGAIAAAVDVAATAAAWATPRATLRARGTTVGFSLSFLSAGLGRDLFADARVVKRGGSLVVIEVSVEDAAGAAVARALVTYKLSLPAAEAATG
jgi:uncharacterized protein (TIGR00369 family)